MRFVDANNKIEIINIKKNYPPKSIKFPDFTSINGDFVVITGKSGSGKSTFCEICAKFVKTDFGTIYINDLDINKQNVFDSIHYLSQTPSSNLIGPTSVEDIELWIDNQCASLSSSYKEEKIKDLSKKSLADSILTQFKLYEHKDTPVWNLSFGQKKILSIAGIVSVPRSIWVLDEPFSGLDEDHRLLLTDLLSTFIGNGGIIISTSHTVEGMTKIPISNVIDINDNQNSNKAQEEDESITIMEPLFINFHLKALLIINILLTSAIFLSKDLYCSTFVYIFSLYASLCFFPPRIITKYFYLLNKFKILLITLFLFQILFRNSGEKIFIFYFLNLSEDGIYYGFSSLLRYLVILLSAIMLANTSPYEMIKALRTWRLPEQLIIIVSFTILFLRQLQEDFQVLIKNMSKRNIAFKGRSWKNRLEIGSQLIIPIIGNIFTDIKHKVFAMELNGYGYYKRVPTFFYKKCRLRDYWIIFCYLFIIFFLLSFDLRQISFSLLG